MTKYNDKHWTIGQSGMRTYIEHEGGPDLVWWWDQYSIQVETEFNSEDCPANWILA